MSLKLEDIPVPERTSARGNGNFREFVTALRDLKKGQSFLYPDLASNDRMAISIVQMLFNREYVTRKEGKAFRVGRVA